MKRIFFIGHLCITFTCNCIAQNLVANGDFESYFWCPTQFDQGSNAVAWGSGNSYIFPEYFNSCASLSSLVSTPLNIDSLLGYQIPHSGNGYSGINVFIDNYPYPKDYLQTKLIDSLDSGKYYCLKFYVSLCNPSKWGIDALGAYFDKQPSTICSTFTCVLNYTPQVSNPVGNILLDTLNWMKIEGCFQAQGGERYMIIGNFKDTVQTQKAINVPGGFGWSTYYYIDDVSLYEDSTLNLKENIEEENVLIFPNPADQQITIKYNKVDGLTSYSVVDLLGNQILVGYLNKSNNTIDVSNLKNGIYFVNFTNNTEFISTHKIIISH